MTASAEGINAVARVTAAYHRIDEVDRPEVWITLRPRDEVMAEAERVDAAPRGALSGRVLAIKDNIDVAGLPTTAACRAFAYQPGEDAAAVARLRAAGAIVLGKTNLDQFATGLVGTRSPYGAVHDATRPGFVSGGSSSGSAVAVALGIADLGLGTDTAGSGRVPAAFQGIVGLKLTRGLIPTAGVVPACRTLDCVSLLARDVASAHHAAWLMTGRDRHPTGAAGALDREWPPAAALAAPSAPRVGVPSEGELVELSADSRRAFAGAVARVSSLGAEIVPVDIEPLVQAGQLLYAGAFVAERDAAFGEFARAHPHEMDPSVLRIINDAAELPARQLVAGAEALDALRVAVRPTLESCDALLLPTVSRHPTIAEVQADPITVNAELGRYTNFVNLLDLCAYAVPAGRADGGHFGVSFVAWAFSDRVIEDLAARFLGEPTLPLIDSGPRGIPLLVIGAHRTGQPLNHQLSETGGRLLGIAATAPGYRMYALDTDPPKPGLIRVDGDRDGTSIEGEVWDIPAAHLGPLLASLPRPMTLGRVTLSDGAEVVGFLCEPAGASGATDISSFGSWLTYRRTLGRS